MKNTSADFAIVSNTDVEFHAGAINKMIDYLYSHKEVGAIGPQQIYSDGSWQRCYGVVPGILEGVNDLFGITSLNHLLKRKMWSGSQGKNKPKAVGYIDGAVIAFRRDAFQAVDGSDEDFFFLERKLISV